MPSRNDCSSAYAAGSGAARTFSHSLPVTIRTFYCGMKAAGTGLSPANPKLTV
jgi:hypothetical protein